MENTVGIRELQQHASAVVRRVRDGEVLVVTDHGTPVAKMIPAGPTTLAELAQAGLVSTPDKDLSDLLARIPRGNPSRAGTEALRELRKDP